MHDFPAPNLLGAPARFDKWRTLQADALLAAAYSSKRFIVVGAPTGFGKSLVYVSHALLTDSRSFVLTSTKALQSQLNRDFAESGLVEIKGMNAYDCLEGTPTGRFGDYRREGYRADRGLPMSCEEAPCQSGIFCHRKQGGCLYYDAYRTACSPSSRLGVTNYQYWMHINKYGEGLGEPIDLLILDEAHQAMDELGSFIGTEIRQSDIETAMPVRTGRATIMDPGSDALAWREWGGYWAGAVASELEGIRATILETERQIERMGRSGISFPLLKRAKELRRLATKLSTIANIDGDWIVDEQQDRHGYRIVKFDPIWPRKFAERYLFLGIKKVVLVSATVRPETAAQLGIDPNDMEFKEYPSSFPIRHRPIVYLPTVQMNNKVEHENMKHMSSRIDHIIGRRLDRKGIIQTVSYARARAVFHNSEYRQFMMQHSPDDTRDTIFRFKSAKPPMVLVSPVVDTGYDFPYDEAEYQILVKVPFPVITDKITKARAERDPNYKDFLTAITLVQMAGRIVRAEDDTGETFILDSDFGWWYYGKRDGKRFTPRWFQEAVRKEDSLNPALTKLARSVR